MSRREVVTGTYGDKYSSRNPVARWMVRGFLDDVEQLARSTGARRVLEVGAGEGEVTRRVVEALQPAWYLASDLTRSCVDGVVTRARAARCALLSADALPLCDGAADLIVACEVLEHLDDPRGALAELRRVGSRWLLASVPREPLWRALNLARLEYLAELGNTPGHVQHWTRSDFLELVSAFGRVEEVRGPIPWTIALVRKA